MIVVGVVLIGVPRYIQSFSVGLTKVNLGGVQQLYTYKSFIFALASSWHIVWLHDHTNLSPVHYRPFLKYVYYHFPPFLIVFRNMSLLPIFFASITFIKPADACPREVSSMRHWKHFFSEIYSLKW